MKTLYIVRHAKSSWKFPELSDIDRPLNKRGKRDVNAMAQFVAKQISPPDIFLSSPSKRTYDTAKEFLAAFGKNNKVLNVTDDLYHASSQAWRSVVTELPDNSNSAMLFGHNPGITDFVNRIGQQNIYNIPTCGVAAIELDASQWKVLGEIHGRLKFYYYPKGIASGI